MTPSETKFAPAVLEQEQDPFELADLYPRNTGLPMTVWASVQGGARHDARVKVCMAHGDRMDPGNTAVVAIRPLPRLLHGTLPPADLAAVAAWVALNEVALIDYWDGRIDTLEFAQRLRKV